MKANRMPPSRSSLGSFKSEHARRGIVCAVSLLGLSVQGLAGCSRSDCSEDCPPPPMCLLQEPKTTCEEVNLKGCETGNRLGTPQLTFNAVLANATSTALLLDKPLSTDTFLGDEYLSRQLEDPWAQEFMQYLVTCALPDGASVQWQSIHDAEPILWPGSLSLCPQWADGSVAEDIDCQEQVSACLLALNNALHTRVAVSVRRQLESLPAGDPQGEIVSAQFEQDAASQVACTASEVTAGEARNCGWKGENSGLCQPGTQVSVTRECTGESDVLLRVCDGTFACDDLSGEDPSPVLVQATASCDQTLSFECTETGTFAVMSADPGAMVSESPVTVSGSDNTLYPVRHKRFFTWQEGAFYGNLFEGISEDSPIQRVEVDPDGVVTYNTPDEKIYQTACRENLGSYEESDLLRRQKHDDFLDRVKFDDATVVFENAFSCAAPSWSHDRAYGSRRLCAGDAGKSLCVADSLGDCWERFGANNRCQLSDSTPVDGERDFDACQGNGKTWNHPLTVFLNDPCDILGDGDPLCEDIKRATVIESKFYHTCAVIADDALLADDAVSCWGRNTFGQLGYGHTAHVGDDDAPAEWGTVDVGARLPVRITALATGELHTCALKSDGRVRCWGANADGQLGHGNQRIIGDDELPSAVGDVPVGVSVTQVVAGERHTCVLGADRNVRCWGLGIHGQLGRGNTATIGDNETPDSVNPVNLGNARVRQIASGSRFVCALADNGPAQEVYCWGDNSQGQLGLGWPKTERIGDNELPTAGGALRLPAGIGTIEQLVAGFEFACVLTQDRSIYCWGDNEKGQLGSGDGVDITDASRVRAITIGDPGDPVTRITAGQYHACAQLQSGKVRCWGGNDQGQLGYVDPTHPFPPSSRDLIVGEVSVDLTAGALHTCVIAKDNGTVRCWGDNHNWNGELYGQLGHSCLLFDPTCQPIGDDELPIEQGDLPLL